MCQMFLGNLVLVTQIQLLLVLWSRRSLLSMRNHLETETVLKNFLIECGAFL